MHSLILYWVDYTKLLTKNAHVILLHKFYKINNFNSILDLINKTWLPSCKGNLQEIVLQFAKNFASNYPFPFEVSMNNNFRKLALFWFFPIWIDFSCWLYFSLTSPILPLTLHTHTSEIPLLCWFWNELLILLYYQSFTFNPKITQLLFG